MREALVRAAEAVGDCVESSVLRFPGLR